LHSLDSIFSCLVTKPGLQKRAAGMSFGWIGYVGSISLSLALSILITVCLLVPERAQIGLQKRATRRRNQGG
jgi:hypothetical protein